MSARVWVATVALAALGLALAFAALRADRASAPLAEVRDRPLFLSAGPLQKGAALGQRLALERGTLRRLELVALVDPSQPLLGAPTLEVRAGSPGGELLARAVASDALPVEGAGVPPIARSLVYTLDPPVPADVEPFLVFARGGVRCVPLLRHRGPTQAGRPNAGVPHRGELAWTVRGRLEDLSGLALELRALPGGVGPLTLELWSLGAPTELLPDEAAPGFQDDPLPTPDAAWFAAREPLRRVTLEPRVALAGATLPFEFEPLADSRLHRYAVRVTLPDGAVLAGDRRGPGFTFLHGSALHGSAEPTGPFRGAWLGAAPLERTDLVLRLFGEPGDAPTERPPFGLAGLGALWLAGALLAARGLVRATGSTG